MITHFDMASCAMIVEPGDAGASSQRQLPARESIEARLQSVDEALSFEGHSATSLPTDLATVSACEFIDAQR